MNKETTPAAIAKIASAQTQNDGKLLEPSCFVIMSFSKNPIIESYYSEAIEQTVAKAKLKCIRVDRENYIGKISDKIYKSIQEAAVVIIDSTEDKPNCYFEAGFAHALGKKIIWIRSDAPNFKSPIPFDVQDFPHILYGTTEDLRKRLSKLLKAVIES